MQLVCKGRIVVAHYDDGVSVPMSAFPGATLQAYAGTLDALARVGDPPTALPGIRMPDDRPYAAPAIDLPALQASLCADIDTQAEAQRQIYITGGDGQMAVYLQKQTQAAGALAGAAQNPAMTAQAGAAAFVLLAAEVGITVDPSTKAPATDVFGVARAVAAVVGVWLPIAAAIEGMRLKTKAAVNAATTAAAAQAAHDAVAWPAPPSA